MIGELEIIRKATKEMLNEIMNAGNKDEVTKLWDKKISDLKICVKYSQVRLL